MSYSRNAAVDYAEKNWKTNCHDGVISIIGAPIISVEAKKREFGLTPPSAWSVEWMRNFQHDDGHGRLVTEQEAAAFVGPGRSIVFLQGWAGLGDCAHFLTSCLTAGGVRDLKSDFVPYVNSFLRNLPFTKIVGDELSQDGTRRIIEKRIMKQGDVILYFAVPGPGAELGGGYVHSAIFVSPSTISCHTISRWDEPWDAPHDGVGFRFTLVHFSHDDPPIPEDAILAGWWEMNWRGTPYFYFFERGRAWYTKSRPTSKGNPGLRTGTGYYFEPRVASRSDFLICWNETGAVEEFAISPNRQSLTGTWNGSEQITGHRL